MRSWASEIQNLPGGEAGILERGVGQIHLHAQLFAHLAHGGGEATGAAVGDGGVEAPVARQLNQFNEPLLRNGVADLDGTAGGLGRLVRQLGRREGGAVDAVAAGAPAKRDHQVADLGGTRVLADGQQAGAAAEDERVAQVALVVDHGAVDRGDAQLVAVVADARHHAIRNALRMEDAIGQAVVGVVMRAKAEHVGVGDRAGRDADEVAHHAAHARVGAAKGFQGRRVVVRLDLEGEVIVVVKGDDTGIIHKSRFQPAGMQLVRCCGQILVNEAVNHLLLANVAGGIQPSKVYLCLKGLVDTVL